MKKNRFVFGFEGWGIFLICGIVFRRTRGVLGELFGVLCFVLGNMFSFMKKPEEEEKEKEEDDREKKLKELEEEEKKEIEQAKREYNEKVKDLLEVCFLFFFFFWKKRTEKEPPPPSLPLSHSAGKEGERRRAEEGNGQGFELGWS